MSNPYLDSAITAMRSTAERGGNKSLMTFTPEGHALILIGSDEDQVTEILTNAIVQIEARREEGNDG